jgi:multidrug resistance efflux pump
MIHSFNDMVTVILFALSGALLWFSIGYQVGRGKRRQLFGRILSVTPQRDGSVVTVCVKEPKR